MKTESKPLNWKRNERIVLTSGAYTIRRGKLRNRPWELWRLETLLGAWTFLEEAKDMAEWNEIKLSAVEDRGLIQWLVEEVGGSMDADTSAEEIAEMVVQLGGSMHEGVRVANALGR